MARIFGSRQDDTLTGTASRDSLYGRDGNDQIFGDLGNDLIRGSNGADLLSGDAGNDRLFGGRGNDTLLGGLGADRIFGGSGDDLIVADQGNDRLNGGRGNDVYIFSGSFGRDFIQDPFGQNVLDLTTLNGNLTVNLVRSGLKIRLGENSINWTSSTRIYKVLTGNGDDFFLGFARRSESFDGGLGDDTLSYRNIQGTRFGLLIEGDFADGVDGLAGRTNFRGRADDFINTDRIFGTKARDTLSLENTPNGVSVDLKNGTAEDLVTGRLFEFTSIENLAGSSQDDQLTGNDLANTIDGGDGNDFIDGGIGRDTMIGGAGDDIYVVDNSDDIVSELFGEGNDSVRSSINYILQDNIENLTLLGNGNLRGTGNRSDNLLIGNGGANILNGLAGNDFLQGGDGNDEYLYNYFLSSNESDRILDTDGNDTIDFTNFNGGVTVEEARNWIWHALDSGTDTDFNIDQLQIVTTDELTITIDNYFNNQIGSIASLNSTHAGQGLVEIMQFADGSLRISDILGLLS
ncbi:MAG: calcium-binding protein [Candidatus Caenarcaniphilales bacterium]|nr:calcium-binding protein [Candidatus Caenarcaniphilales bacterium]